MSIIKIGKIEFDLKVLFKLLKLDLKDDWFQDPIMFADLFKDNYNNEDLIQSRVCEKGIYHPSERILLNVPKPRFTLRYSLEQDFKDRLVYQGLGLYLAEKYDGIMSRRILSHRLNKEEFEKKRYKYLFLNSIEQWKKFEGYVRYELNKSKGTLLITDLQNYYETIAIKDIKATLKKYLATVSKNITDKEEITYVIEILDNCLKEWSYNTKNGIPQNRDTSSVLANILLTNIDNKMIDMGYEYYRYMDDIRIVVSNEGDAKKALKLLINELRKYNLNVNSFKTDIIKPDSEDYVEYIERSNKDLEYVDSLWKTKKLHYVSRSFMILNQMMNNLLDKGETDSKHFRFCIGRLEKIALCNDIEKPKDLFDNFYENLSDILWNHPTSTDQVIKIVMASEPKGEVPKIIENFLVDSNRSIYSWQNYLLWKTLIFLKYSSEKLTKHAKNILEKNNTIPNLMGAILYLGSINKLTRNLSILESRGLESVFLIRRHIIIGIHKLKKRTIRRIPFVLRDDEYTMIDYLRSQNWEKLVKGPDPVAYTEIFNSMGHYLE